MGSKHLTESSFTGAKGRGSPPHHVAAVLSWAVAQKSNGLPQASHSSALLLLSQQAGPPLLQHGGGPSLGP